MGCNNICIKACKLIETWVLIELIIILPVSAYKMYKIHCSILFGYMHLNTNNS